MIGESILISIITGLFSTIGAIIGVFGLLKKKAHDDEVKAVERETRQGMRLDTIEKKLDEHNHYAKKFEDVEKTIVEIKKDIHYLGRDINGSKKENN